MLKELLPPITEQEMMRHAELAQKGHLYSKEQKEWQILDQQKRESVLTPQERQVYESIRLLEHPTELQKTNLIQICNKIGADVPKRWGIKAPATALPIRVKRKAWMYYLIGLAVFLISTSLILFTDLRLDKSSFYLVQLSAFLAFIILASRWNRIMSPITVEQPRYLILKQLVSYNIVFYISKFILSFLVGYILVTASLGITFFVALAADILTYSAAGLFGAHLPWAFSSRNAKR